MVKNNVTKIIVLGAGFVGIRVVQDLANALRKSHTEGVKVFLVDRENTHLYRADLYEVATAFDKKITQECLTELKETIATPINSLIDPDYVEFVHDEVINIDEKSAVVTLKKAGDLKYDYLVVGLGSETNYFGIKGLKENSFALKTVQDGLKINCHLDAFFHDLWKKKNKPDVYINIGGGGPTGVETAGELIGSMEKMSKKYGFPIRKIHVQLIEGSDKLLGLDLEGTDIVLKRLKQLGVKVFLQRFIQKVDKNKITLKVCGKKTELIHSDILIWTGGVMVSSIIQKTIGDKKLRGAILVNPFLQSTVYRNVFAAGDNAYFRNPDNLKVCLPMLGQVAVKQGTVIAQNLMNLIEGNLLVEFEAPGVKLLVPIGGKFALLKAGDVVFKGFWVWVLKRLVYLKYSLSILPFWKAVKKFFHSTEIFMDND